MKITNDYTRQPEKPKFVLCKKLVTDVLLYKDILPLVNGQLYFDHQVKKLSCSENVNELQMDQEIWGESRGHTREFLILEIGLTECSNYALKPL